MKAAFEGHSRVVDELLIHAADVNSKNNVSNRLRNIECTSISCTYMFFTSSSKYSSYTCTCTCTCSHAHVFLFAVLDNRNG